MGRNDQNIIVVGAGAAGLMAAKQLSQKHNVIVLEGNDRIGGRIHTVRPPGFTQAIEAGAEFIHGNLPLTLELLKKAGIATQETGGRFYRADQTASPGQFELFGQWDQLLGKMNDEKQDMTLDKFLQKYYPDEKYHAFREQIRGYAEGFDAADITKASMKSLMNEWSHEDHEAYRIPGGYGQLMDWLAAECKKNGAHIVTSSFVTQINWEKNKVLVTTKGGQQYPGEKCIITVPIVLLQQRNAKSLNFRPLPETHVDAAKEIGYSTVIKIVIEFDTPFWDSFANDIGFIMGGAQKIPTWWTQFPDRVPILTGWKAGPGAIVLSEKNDAEILDLALNSLCNIFKRSEKELRQKMIASSVFNWLNDEFAGGAYSYDYPSSVNARKLLTTPIADTIFFAGEALTTEGSLGTVEAALVTGKKIASKIDEHH